MEQHLVLIKRIKELSLYNQSNLLHGIVIYLKIGDIKFAKELAQVHSDKLKDKNLQLIKDSFGDISRFGFRYTDYRINT